MAKVIGVKIPDEVAEKYEGLARCAGCETVASWFRKLADSPQASSLGSFPIVVSEEQRGRIERAAKRDGKTPQEWLLGLAEREIAPPKPVEVAKPQPAEAGPSPWAPVLQELRTLAKTDPEKAKKKFADLTGEGFQQPNGWREMTMEQRARYLDVVAPYQIPPTGEDAIYAAKCREEFPQQTAAAETRSIKFRRKDAWGRMNWEGRYNEMRSARDAGDTGAA